MSDFKAHCGCTIHVVQWTSKRKIASVKHCSLHGAAKELLEVAKNLRSSVISECGDCGDCGACKAREVIAKAEGAATPVQRETKGGS